ncbi:MAG: transcriptional repressor, partial [Syntrophomonadaceae bacterium]|nr:transcriptional repressor [Syntrophomonadaceae bacterium]
MVAFKEQLAARGYKITPQRRLILEALNDADRHLSADEVAAQVKKIEPSISLATIYR